MKTILLLMCLGLSGLVCAAQNQGAATKAKKENPNDAQLISCVKDGDADCVTHALASGANANAIDEEGVAALILAAEGKSARIVRLLLNAGAAVDKAQQGEGTPLCRAALFGREEIVEALLSAGAKINVVCDGDHGDTPLMDALRGAWLSALPADLQEEFTGTGDSSDKGDGKANATGETTEKEGKWREVLKSPHESFLVIARKLLARGADVNVSARCSLSETALMYAAMGADVAMVKEILSHGADIKTGGAVLALLRECELENEKAKILALPALSKDQSAMFEWNEKTRAAREEIKQLLKAAGAEEIEDEDKEDAESSDETLEETANEAFSSTIKKNDSKELERLIEAYASHPLGARVLPEAIRIALIYGRREMFKLLLARGVNPNGAQSSTLILAANNGDLEYVLMLLEAGADVNATDRDGRTALDAAESWGDPDEERNAVIEALKARGGRSTRQK
jgi:ankyrin repeat protein